MSARIKVMLLEKSYLLNNCFPETEYVRKVTLDYATIINQYSMRPKGNSLFLS